MNLNAILEEAGALLNMDVDVASSSIYFVKFRKFANDAVRIISKRFKENRSEVVDLDEENCFDLGYLNRTPLKIEKIMLVDSEKPLYWEQVNGRGTGIIRVYFPKELEETPPTQVAVRYSYEPRRLETGEDIPEVPEFSHYLIPYFIAAQHRFSQDGDVAGMGNYQMQMFNQGLQDLEREQYGERRSYNLKGYNYHLI